jgi:hypothetical protein
MSVWQVASIPFWLCSVVGFLLAVKISLEPAEDHERSEVDLEAMFVLAVGLFLFFFAAWMWRW